MKLIEISRKVGDNPDPTVVAEGVIFGNGHCVIAWLGRHASVAVYPSVEDAIAVHGHEGTTIEVVHDHDRAVVRVPLALGRAGGAPGLLPREPPCPRSGPGVARAPMQSGARPALYAARAAARAAASAAWRALTSRSTAARSSPVRSNFSTM